MFAPDLERARENLSMNLKLSDRALSRQVKQVVNCRKGESWVLIFELTLPDTMT
jgi:hypothetical protein